MVTCLAFFSTLMRGSSVEEFELITCAAGLGFVAWMLTFFSVQILSATFHQSVNRLSDSSFHSDPWNIACYI